MNNEDNTAQPPAAPFEERDQASELLPLTPNQEAIWFEQKLYPDSSLYNTGGYLAIRGPIEEETLKRALAMVIDCNDALRTQFHEKDGQPLQEFWPVFPYDAESRDFSAGEFPEDSCVQWMHQQFEETFHLNHPPLFQVAILKASDHLYYLFARFHHIIIDGWGVLLFFKTIEQFYNSLLANQVPDECYSYLQYIRGQIGYFESDKFETDKAFWKEMFTPPPEPLLSPRDGAAAFDGPIPNRRHTTYLERKRYDRLEELAGQYKTSLFYLFTGILYLYMSRIYGKPDMVIAFPISNRKGKIEKETIGMFTGLSPLRINVDGSITLAGLFHLIGSDLRKTYRHQQMPINYINKNIEHIDLNRRQLHDISLAYIPLSDNLQLGHSDTDPVISIPSGFQQIPLAVEIGEFSRTEDIVINFDYLVDYLEEDDVDGIASHFFWLLENIENNINTPLKDIDIVTSQEKKLLVDTFNQTAAQFPENKTIIDLFEDQVKKFPDRTALITTTATGDMRSNNSYIKSYNTYWSYKQLDLLSTGAANELSGQGVQAGQIVALMAQPGIEMIRSLLGILKAGAAYLPINPEYPEERIDYMLADSAAFLFSPGETPQYMSSSSSPLNKSKRVPPKNPAYVIYTSGSTGRPKGCLITHMNLVRLITNSDFPFEFDEHDRWVMAHSFAFDFSVWEMYGALLYGASLLLPQRREVRDTKIFLELIKTFGITILNQTPGAFYQLLHEKNRLNAGLYLRYIIFGGEKLEPQRLKPWTELYPADKVLLINMYGITENTVHTTIYTIDAQDIDAPESLSPIGKPLPGVYIYILDENHKLLPIGAAGEMALAGDGLSPGYLNNPELSAERFLPAQPGKGSHRSFRSYKSGDIARWTPDGNLEYLGRKDRQVKIRGHRIEFAEIEFYLLNHPAIKDTVVTVRTGADDEKELAAYVVFTEDEEDKTPAIKDLRTFLAKLLPDYMTPSYFVSIPHVPLTPNGKTDYRALSRMEGESLESGTGYTAPRNETESSLSRIWQDVLNCDKVGVHDNFFDLGGHSLTATRAASRIHGELAVEIGLRDIFIHPTLAQLAEFIDGKRQSPLASIPAVAQKDYYTLSPGQRRLWMMDRLEGPGISYNIPILLELTGPLDKALLESAFRSLIDRRQSLRTSFHMIDGEPIQRIHPQVEFSIGPTGPVSPISHPLPKPRPFDLSKAPLMRVELIPQTKESHLLFIEFHHIISDAWSLGVVFRELQRLYNNPGTSLSPLTTQYKDYTLWLEDKLASPQGEAQARYWQKRFDPALGQVPVLDLPVDFHRPAVKTSEGSIFEVPMGRAVSLRLEQFCGGREVTPFMTLMAAVFVMLRFYTRQEDIVLGTPIAGRGHPDLENQVGFFINTLPIRCRPTGDTSFENFLGQVRDITLEAYENQLYPFDRLVDELQLERGAGRNPLFDVMVAMQTGGSMTPELHLKDLETAALDMPYTISKFDLTFEFVPADSEHGLLIRIEYNTRLYLEDTIKRISGHLIQLLENIIATPGKPIRHLDIVSAAERERLLVQFNRREHPYSNDFTLPSLFESQVEKYADNPALVFTGNSPNRPPHTLTYGGLNRKANLLAKHLSEKGIGAGKVAGIIVNPSMERIIAILAVLKTGAAYLPINPKLPPVRVRYMLNDSSAAMVLCSPEYLEAAKEENQWTVIDVDDPELYRGESASFTTACNPGHLAYIIYTSGSTGKPKGVPITHANTSPLFLWLREYLNFNSSDRIVNNLSYYFDGGIWELFLALTSGASYFITTEDIAMNPPVYIGFINQNRITYLDITPTKMEVLVKEEIAMPSLRYLCIAAERVMLTLTAACLPLLNPECRIINMYGPTETTILSTSYLLNPEDLPGLRQRVLSLPIGKPIANDQVAVLNREMKPCPIGVKGELYIGGDSLAKGYINDPEKTASAFIPNPLPEIPGKFLYKTGDQVVWLPDGNLEFLARFDHQLKIRGLRVEPGEIEHVLDNHPHIRQSVVIAREIDGQTELLAYFIPLNQEAAGEITVATLRDYLGKHLPMYMMPSYFVPLDSFPLNPNGKTDRRRLPDPRTQALGGGASYIAPQNEIEEKLSAVWKILLNKSTIGIDDNFFESGGNSMKVIQAAGLLSKTFGKNIPVTRMMEFPTIRSFARHLMEQELKPVSTEPAPLSVSEAGVSEPEIPAPPVNPSIAVIGMACRFPGAPDIDRFWDNIKNGVESVSFFDESELAAAGAGQETFEDDGFVKARGGVMEKKEYFDAHFFDYLPSEAAMMDPQVRVFHECAWTALEHAGYGPGTGTGETGIWAGAAPSTGWEILTLLSGQRHILGEFASQNLASSQFLTTRVSYKLNLKGPAINIQTACSTSLTAIHMACQGLLNGVCDMALAGGVSIPIYNIKGYVYNEEMIFSKDGHCRAFDALSSGTINGEGAGLVVLKRLDRAMEDGDMIHAVIKGGAINNDGDEKPGYEAPGIRGQARVIRSALEDAKIDASAITYIETHGTGTPLGDPIEIEALNQVFKDAAKEESDSIPIGSLKTNVGHMDAAAGVGGFIKTVLALKHKVLPPSLHFITPNPRIDFNGGPFYVNATLKPWPPGPEDSPRRAGVSSFGIGGANAHVILEEAPTMPPQPPEILEGERRYRILRLSARSETALDQLNADFVKFLEQNPGSDIGDVAYTLAVGRTLMPYKQSLVAAGIDGALDCLSDSSSCKVRRLFSQPEAMDIVFMFPGQGSQYTGMARDLYQTEPVFRREVDGCFEILKTLTSTGLKSILYPDGQDIPGINQTGITQPILFTVEYALARLLMAWGIHPHAMLGYSLGEYVAACLAGVMSLQDALKLVSIRGRLVEKVPPGALLSVPATWKEIQAMIEEFAQSTDGGKPAIGLAADNGDSCIISGSDEVISAFEKKMRKKIFAAVRIQASHAIHSPMMEPVVAEFKQAVREVELQPPKLPYVSNITGNWINGEEATDPDYWARHLLSPVQFDRSIVNLLEKEKVAFIEAGPGNAISSLIRRRKDISDKHIVVHLTRLPQEDIPDDEFLMGKLSYLELCGIHIDWPAYYNIEQRRRLPLPTYPFEGGKYWLSGDPYNIAAGELKEIPVEFHRDETPAPSERFNRTHTGVPYVAPQTGTEIQLSSILQEFMGIHSISVNDNFFDLGGDSLKLMTISLKVHKQMGYRLPVADYFSYPSIKELAAHIDELELESTELTAIQALEKRSSYAVSNGQRRMWVLHQFAEQQTGYNMPAAFTLETGAPASDQTPDQTLNIDALNNAFRTLIQRHEILRTAFLMMDGELRQVVKEPDRITFQIEKEDLAPVVHHELAARIRSYAAAPFKLEEPPLFRAKRIRMEPGRHVLLFNMHHIISDGWSMNVFTGELTQLYNNYIEDRETDLPPLTIQYKDYAAWQNFFLESEAAEALRHFWLAEMTAPVPVLELPADNARPPFKSYEGDRLQCRIEPELVNGIQRLCVDSGATLFMVLFSAVHTLLYHYSGQQDIIIGTPVAGRSHPDLDRQIGLYMNMLPLRLKPDVSKGFDTFLEQVIQTVTAALEHQAYPFDRLVDELDLDRDTSRHPLFDVVVILQNTPRAALQLKGIDIAPLDDSLQYVTSPYDITFNFEEEDDIIRLDMEYRTALYSAGRIRRMWTHFNRLLLHIMQQPDNPLQNLTLMSQEERQQVIQTFNSTVRGYPEEKSVIHLFSGQAARTPDKTALTGLERNKSNRFYWSNRTYKQLDQQSGDLAVQYREQGVFPGAIVPLKAERTMDLAAHILAILKTGAAYLPIAPDFPEERIQYMLRDSAAREFAIKSFVEEGDIGSGSMLARSGGVSSNGAPSPQSAAYVTYTSGSTGRPKGVVIEHRNIVSFTQNLEHTFGIAPEDRIYALTTFTFDISVLELLCSLLNGNTVVMESFPENLESMAQNILNQAVSVIQITPSRLSFMLESLGTSFLANLRILLVGGESMPRQLWDTLAGLTHLSAYNVYGPTETTIWSSAAPITGDAPTIGKPLLNEAIYILSTSSHPSPIGIPGEIHIGGHGLGRGYLNQPELTALSFIHTIKSFAGSRGGFSKEPLAAGGVLYKTGDQASWQEDGNIKFLGRTDQQVKLRGFRIEPEEIEFHLLTYPGISEAAVVVTQLDGEDQLAVFVSGDIRLDQQTVNSIKEHLGRFLPAYMIPHYYRLLEQLPVTSSNKTDRKALTRLAVSSETGPRQPAAARGETQRKLIAIWREILNHENIGIKDNFFRLGGHSLKATRVVSAIHREMSVQTGLGDIFKNPTIEGLARVIDEAQAQRAPVKYQEIPAVEKRHYYPLSHSQRRLWVLDRFSKERISYNIPSAFRLKGELDIAFLSQVFSRLIERHEILRTSFISLRGEPVQVVHEAFQYSVPVESMEEAQTKERMIAHASKPFDLSKAPLFDVLVLKLEARDFILLFNIHHIITDGWSVGVLIDELKTLYSHTPSPLAIQYKDFVQWQNRRLEAQSMQPVKSWWRQQFTPSDEIPVLDLPVDFPRPAVKSQDGDVLEFELSPWLTRELYQLSRYHDCTLFMTLLAAVHLLLYRYTGQEDVVIGSPVAGRGHPQLEDQIGFYVNTLALRHRIDPLESFDDFLQRVKQNATEAFENREYPFDRLVDELELERDTSRHPLFDVMVILQNVETGSFELPGLEIEPLDIPFHTSKFDLTFSFTESPEPGGTLRAAIEYNTALFKKDRIIRLWGHFTRLAAGIAGSFGGKVSGIDILPGAERQRLLESFNATSVDYGPETGLLQLFKKQVQRAPDATAAAFSGGNRSHWAYRSYKELDRRSSQLALHLRRESGVQSGDIVAVSAQRHPFIIEALLAILKLGAIYLPVDPSFPKKRSDYILADSRPRVFIDTELVVGGPYEEQELNAVPESEAHGAYIIYTSGSTGKPKGVLGTRQCLSNLIRWQMDYFNIEESGGLRSILYSALNFDVSIQEMLFSLCSGGLLYITGDELKREPLRMMEFLKTQAIQLITLPFSGLNLLFQEASVLEEIVSLKHIITSGEQLQLSESIAGFLAARPDVLLHNQYGPSESHVVTSYTLSGEQGEGDKQPPIGKPVANTRCFILDNNMNPVPTGIIGELYLAGIHLAMGYLNNPELTVQRFLIHPAGGPYNSAGPQSSALARSGGVCPNGNRTQVCIYKTGDLASWQEDGNIKFLGRRDKQVKIRGFRVEPEEIQTHLLNHPEVKEAVILVSEDGEGAKILTAAIVPAGAASVTEASLRDHLTSFLPDYMIPAQFALFEDEQFPLTPSGKTDISELTRLVSMAQRPPAGRQYTAPRTAVENGLARIWQEVLNREEIGIHDHFFRIGGHSLKATQVSSRINRELAINIDLHDIFTHPTIAGLAKLAGDGERTAQTEEQTVVKIPAVPEQSYYETSHAQKRLWVIHRMEENLTAYNIPMALELHGTIDSAAFIRALETIVQRHEALRTTFIALDGDPKQRIREYQDCGFTVETLDLRDRKDRDKVAGDMAMEDAVKSFDLEKGPLIRAQLLHMEEDRFILLLNLHHIIADGWSTQVMRHEIYTLYRAYADKRDNPLPPLPIQYKDFAAWQNNNISGEDERYWLNKLAAPLSLVNFIYDFPKQDFNTFEGGMEKRIIPVELTSQLQTIAHDNDVTLSSVILAVFNIFLSRLTGQTDILIASSIANRVNPDVEKLIGFFVNMLIIRSNLSGDLSFEDFLKQVHQTQLEAFGHQEYPFDLLVDKLNPRRYTNYQPLFNVGFAFQNFADVTIDMDLEKPDFGAFEMGVLHEETNHFTSIFDLVLFAAMNNEQMELTMEYNGRLFKKETIQGYLDDIGQFLYYISEQSENKES